MDRPLTCATVIARTLKSSGVRYVFGHPGGEVVDLIEALETHGIRFVLTGHESAAAFMASTAGRMTGIPGVCLATLGPGACNLVLGVGCAYLDRDPMLAISARTVASRIRMSDKQNLRLNEIFAPISKWSAALDGADTGGTVRSALSVAATPPCGPVYLTLPNDVAVALDRPAAAGPSPPGGPALDDLPAPRVSARQAGGVFEEIVQALNNAKRPIGVVGIALDAEKDVRAVRGFFEQTGIPYVSLPQAKGIANEAGGGYLGTVASAAGDAVLVEALEQSDCLLGVGFDPVESAQDWHFHRPVYSLANTSIRFGDYRPAAECVGDVSALLQRLGKAYRGGSEWTQAEAGEVRERVEAAMRPPDASGPAGVSPYHLMQALAAALPEETIVSTDVGAHKMLLSQVWKARYSRSFLVSNGLSAMGYGVPAALAAALLRPERPVVGVLGDAGFAMMAQELETARRIEVSPLLVVLCDRSLAIIKVAQDMREIPYRGVDFGPVDWGRVAEGFGAKGVGAATPGEVNKAVQDWLGHPRLTVLAVEVDEALYAGLTY